MGAQVTVSLHVVGHTSREAQARTLASMLDATLHLDDGSLGEWRNHMRAWRAGANSGASHVCVLQDDAQPVGDSDTFKDALTRAVMARPEHLISLYMGTGRPGPDPLLRQQIDAANRLNYAWLEQANLMWGVGVVMPAERARAFLSHTPEAEDYYDNRLGLWWRRAVGTPVQYVNPSLVDHADGESLVSTRDQPERKAFTLGIREDYHTPSILLR